MIRIKAMGSMGGDATYPYKAIMDRPYTVREFVDEVIAKKDNWGRIDVSDSPDNRRKEVLCWYQYGKLGERGMREGYDDKLVKSAHGSGGWSRYDFTLMV